jgi:hypothetical protein
MLEHEVFGSGERKKSLLKEIQSLDHLEEERVRRAKTKAELENVALMQNVSWRQKSKATWLKGDHNMTFFSPPCQLS